MLRNSILKSIFITFVSIAMIGCNKEFDNHVVGGEHLTPEELKEQAFLGLTVPFLIEREGDGIYILGLSPHARPFTFNEKVIVGGTKYLKLLKDSEETGIPVRVYVAPNTNDIWFVEEATEEEIRSYEVLRQPEG